MRQNLLKTSNPFSGSKDLKFKKGKITTFDKSVGD